MVNLLVGKLRALGRERRNIIANGAFCVWNRRLIGDFVGVMPVSSRHRVALENVDVETSLKEFPVANNAPRVAK